ncbi:hypothetical protein ES703_94817 [subsurface metagenome]
MMKNKKFDCVQMKWDIQQQIAEESSGLSDAEAHKVQIDKVVQNPILGPFYKKVRSVKGISAK